MTKFVLKRYGQYYHDGGWSEACMSLFDDIDEAKDVASAMTHSGIPGVLVRKVKMAEEKIYA